MSDGLQELQDSARKVLDDLGIAAESRQSWSQFADLGWLMVSTPESRGGLGLGLQAASVLNSEMGRALNTAPYMSALLSIDILGISDFPQRDSLVEQLLSGESYVTCSLADSEFTLSTQAEQDWTISGTGNAFLAADTATYALLQSSSSDWLTLVDLRQEGVSVRYRETWDQTRRLFDLELQDVMIDSGLMLARDDAAARLIARLNVARDFALACDSVGGASAILARTVDYLQTRQQFGRPLALFQALKHRCADLKMQAEAPRALLLDSLQKTDDLSRDDNALKVAGQAARRCKQLACANYLSVCEESLQLHGGIGMTDEHECHLFLKRAMLNEQLGLQRESYEMAIAEEFN